MFNFLIILDYSDVEDSAAAADDGNELGEKNWFYINIRMTSEQSTHSKLTLNTLSGRIAGAQTNLLVSKR